MNSRPYLPLLCLLFIGSGCAALIYEIVWFQLLQLAIGSSAISLGILLGTFMGGMCVGSLLMPVVISPNRHPLRVYAALELGIGFFGLLILIAMPLVGRVYTAWAGTGLASVFLRAFAAGICLLPPTILMGATLPAISRWVKTTPEGIAWLGFFYGGNIAGGVAGSLCAGFYLLRVYDVTIATGAAIALNAIVATAAWILASRSSYAPEPSQPTVAIGLASWPVYVSIAVSGLTALGSEVIWTRILSLHFGATVYTFSLILAVFLMGLGIGSTAGAALARVAVDSRRSLGWCQLFLCAAIAWAAYQNTESLPYWPTNPSIASSPWYTFQLDLVRCMWVVLPGAILWGASFPLALAGVATGDDDAARLASGVYAANTVGAIVGTMLTSFVLVPWIGSSHSEQALIVLSALSALLMLEPSFAHVGSPSVPQRANRVFGTVVLAAAMLGAGLMARSVHPLPGVLVAYGRYAVSRVGQADYLYVGEGISASVAVSQLPSGVLNYHNAGKVQASSEPQDMRLQRMLGHLTTLVPRQTRKVVVIGCGAGVTAGAVSIDPALEQETIAEIEPLVPRVVSTYFAAHNFDVVRNPKVRIHIDDARNFIQTSHEMFDAVTSDPLDPWVKGAAMLYTKEFFEEVKRHLEPGGVMTLFVQLYESNTEAVKSELATFFDAFPEGVIWGNTNEGRGYDLVLLGTLEPAAIDVDAIQAKLERPEYARVAQSLREIGMTSAVDLFSTYAGRKSDLEPWLRDAMINRDRNLRLQYLAGLGLNLYQADAIYADMLRYVTKPPDGLFVGSVETKRALAEAISRHRAAAAVSRLGE